MRRRALLAFVFAVVVAAGSLGLVVVGVLEGAASTRACVFGLAAAMLAGLLALRPLPETVGADVVGSTATSSPRS